MGTRQGQQPHAAYSVDTLKPLLRGRDSVGSSADSGVPAEVAGDAFEGLAGGVCAGVAGFTADFPSIGSNRGPRRALSAATRSRRVRGAFLVDLRNTGPPPTVTLKGGGLIGGGGGAEIGGGRRDRGVSGGGSGGTGVTGGGIGEAGSKMGQVLLARHSPGAKQGSEFSEQHLWPSNPQGSQPLSPQSVYAEQA